MTIPNPVTTVAEMGVAIKVLATNRTPAANGSRYRDISSGGHATYTPSPPAPTHQACSRGSDTHAHCPSDSPIVKNIADNDVDSFCSDEPDRPLRNFEDVYMVTTRFSTVDYPLMSPRGPRPTSSRLRWTLFDLQRD